MASFFQPVVDLIASHPPPNGRLDLVLRLCQAVEAEAGAEIVLATDAVVRNVSPRMSPPVLIPEEVFYEAMARMLLLGEEADLVRLLEWYERPISFASTRRERFAEHWAGIFEFIAMPGPKLSEAERTGQFNRMTTALRCVLAAHMQAVKTETPVRAPDPSLGELPPGSFGTASFGRPPLPTVLADGIRRLFNVWMILHQQWLDTALDQLAANGQDRGKGLRDLRHRWVAALERTFWQEKFRRSAPLAAIPIPLETIHYRRSPHHEYLDAFPVQTDRRFGFRPYDRQPQDEPPAKRIALEDVILRRHQQLHFLLDLFGETYPPTATLPSNAARERERQFAARRQLIDVVARKGGSLDLRTEDGLASFSCRFFEALMASRTTQGKPVSRLEAWGTVFEVLSRYVRLFTSHTKFNLDEAPSYFDREFPRAINGGELLDCGVYAVRLAFVFLSLADCLKSPEYPDPPRVSFILLPVHVGLIVEIDGLAPVIVHNDLMIELVADKEKVAFDEWQASPESSDPGNRDRLRQKFLEDVAAQLFIRDLDMPLRRAPITNVSAPPRKDEIWKAFRQLVVRKIDGLFDTGVRNPASSSFEFDLRFLYVLDLEKQWHDDSVVPFWNLGWVELWKQVAGHDDFEAGRKTLERSSVKRKSYVHELRNLMQSVQKAYGERYFQGKPLSDSNRPKGGLCDPAIEFKGDVLGPKGDLTTELRANRLAGPSAQRITKSCRLANFASSLGPLGQVNQHLSDVETFTNPPFPTPPFVEPLSRHGG